MSNDNKVTRKLRAILSADVKGYSLLMSDDEIHTIQTLKAYRSLMSDLIGQHSGRVVDNPGDNLLAEFSSAVDAVECSVQIQNRLKKENSKFVEDKQLQYRIGVNIGDVVHDGGRIYGEGVNVAARIESLADAGGVCISRSTYDQIKNKVDLETEYLGEHSVKNIEEPVRVYQVLMSADASQALVEESLELPDKPSIAVLPFDNMSGDPSQEYFSDGITEQIINGLCKIHNLFVIARNSSFAYKGKAVSIKQIAEQLGVKYILEGSVQRSGDRIRITAQLIEATTDYHMWSESYDRELEDIFALQDEITMKLISVMEINLTYGEQARSWDSIRTPDMRAYEKLMLANECWYKISKQDVAQAIKFVEDAISLDDNFVFAYISLGFFHITELMSGWSMNPIASVEQVERCAEKALELGDKLDLTHSLLANLYLLKHQHDDAIEEGKKALEISPNGADAHVILAVCYMYNGQPTEAINLFTKALQLNPIPSSLYYGYLSLSHLMNGEYENAIDVAGKCVSIAPNWYVPHLILAGSHIALENEMKAQEGVQNVMRLYPSYSIDVVRMSPFRNESDLNKFIELNRKAGFPEHSPK